MLSLLLLSKYTAFSDFHIYFFPTPFVENVTVMAHGNMLFEENLKNQKWTKFRKYSTESGTRSLKKYTD